MVATLLEILILLYFFVAVIYHSLDLWCWTWANDIHNSLTHWGRVTHICVSKLTIIGSDNGLASGQRQAIIWTNAGMLLIGPLGINNEILIRIHTFSFKKIRLKMLSVKCCPLRLNVLLGAEQATSHYLNQCWPSSLTHICVTGGRWVKPLKWQLFFLETNELTCIFLFQEIDSYIQRASDQGYSAILNLGSKGFSYVTNVALTTAIKVT